VKLQDVFVPLSSEAWFAGISADVRYITKKGQSYPETRMRIKRFIPGMEKANHAILFHNRETDSIIGGQYGGHDINNDGLFLYLFSISDNGIITQERII